jgi:hypothetical protein
MFLLNEMVEKLRQRKWEADCVQMSLTQNDVASPTPLVGQGYLRQDASGKIHFKLYPRTATMPGRVRFPSPGTAGMLIPPSQYYRLTAQTHDGTFWEVSRTIPDIGASYLENGVFQIASGEAQDMKLTRPFDVPTTTCFLKMVFFADVDIPCNAGTETVTTVGGKHRTASMSQNVARFPTAFGDFQVSKTEGMVLVEVEAKAPFPANIEVRIIEALGLVLARPLYWNVLERVESGTDVVNVRMQPNVLKPNLPRPVGKQKYDMDGDVWRLFDRYLTLICSHPETRFHPCSRHLFSVLEASAAAFSARALALGVAVEGIIKAVFRNAATVAPTLKPTVHRLRTHILGWKEFEDESVKSALYKRVEDMLGKILDVSTKSKLYALAKERVVYAAHVKAWDRLRNTSAHGVSPGEDIQLLVDHCDQVTVLMYHLIFKAAGYEGFYEDYSARGYPTRRYRGRPVTEEEIAIAAYFIWENAGRRHGHHREDWFAAKEQLEMGLA